MVSPDPPNPAPPSVQRPPCPICGAPADPAARHAPFCCEKCKLADLGRWLGGKYKVERPAEQRDYEEE